MTFPEDMFLCVKNNVIGTSQLIFSILVTMLDIKEIDMKLSW